MQLINTETSPREIRKMNIRKKDVDIVDVHEIGSQSVILKAYIRKKSLAVKLQTQVVAIREVNFHYNSLSSEALDALRAGRHHKNIINYLGKFVDGGKKHFVFKFIPGRNLIDMVNLYEHISCSFYWIQYALKVTAQVTDAVSFLHGKGFVHQSINTRNVIDVMFQGDCTQSDPFIYLVGFSKAKRIECIENSCMEKSGLRFRRKGKDDRTDHFILDSRVLDLHDIGVLLYTMLEGHPPDDNILWPNKLREQDLKTHFRKTNKHSEVKDEIISFTVDCLNPLRNQKYSMLEYLQRIKTLVKLSSKVDLERKT